MTSWFLARRLQTQLLFWTALIVVISVGVTFEVRTRLNLRMLEQNLRDRIETLVRAVDRTLRLNSGEVPVEAWERRLREFVEADRTLTRLDVVEERNGELRVVASSAESSDLLIRSRPAAITTEIRRIGPERDMISVQPVAASHFFEVVASQRIEAEADPAQSGITQGFAFFEKKKSVAGHG